MLVFAYLPFILLFLTVLLFLCSQLNNTGLYIHVNLYKHKTLVVSVAVFDTRSSSYNGRSYRRVPESTLHLIRGRDWKIYLNRVI